MSTRCNIVLEDGSKDKLWFYRHSDGYPDGAMPLLKKFMDFVKSGKIRDNVGQAGGWLIILGHHEYEKNIEDLNSNSCDSWKVGAIEPTTGEHGDIEYLYTLNLEKKTITTKEI